MSEAMKIQFGEVLVMLEGQAYRPWGRCRDAIFETGRLASALSSPGEAVPPPMTWEEREEVINVARNRAFASLKARGCEFDHVSVDRETFEVDRQLWRILVQTKVGAEEVGFPWENGHVGFQISMNYMAYLKEDMEEKGKEEELAAAMKSLAFESDGDPHPSNGKAPEKVPSTRSEARMKARLIERKTEMTEISVKQFGFTMAFDELVPYELGVEEQFVGLLPVETREVQNLLPLSIHIRQVKIEGGEGRVKLILARNPKLKWVKADETIFRWELAMIWASLLGWKRQVIEEGTRVPLVDFLRRSMAESQLVLTKEARDAFYAVQGKWWSDLTSCVTTKWLAEVREEIHRAICRRSEEPMDAQVKLAIEWVKRSTKIAGPTSIRAWAAMLVLGERGDDWANKATDYVAFHSVPGPMGENYKVWDERLIEAGIDVAIRKAMKGQ